MKCNLGKFDRIFRGIIGVAIVAIAVYFKTWWGTIGLIPFVTAVVGGCPAYLPFGISSCKAD